MIDNYLSEELKQIVDDCAELVRDSEDLPNSSSLQQLKQLFKRGLKLVSKIENSQSSTSFLEDFMSNFSDFTPPTSPESFFDYNPKILSFDSDANSPIYGPFFDETFSVSPLGSSVCSNNDTTFDSFHSVLKQLGFESDEDASVLNGEQFTITQSRKRQSLDDVCDVPNKRFRDLLQVPMNPSSPLFGLSRNRDFQDDVCSCSNTSASSLFENVSPFKFLFGSSQTKYRNTGCCKVYMTPEELFDDILENSR